MSNSIDINLKGGDNPMNSLSFIWVALFKDGIKISQFDTNNTEHRFQEVKDKFKDLAYFNLTNRKGKLFQVNLIQGMIGYNDIVFPYRESKEIKKNIRLIFFRRHTVTLGGNSEEQIHNIEYHLGFQYNDEKGNNRKIILIIDQEGNFIID